jgi:hypothetical protein
MKGTQVVLFCIFATLIVLCCILATLNVNEYLTENFGSTCLDLVPYTVTTKYPLIPDAIFVSVASYRDDECKDTIASIYENASEPDKIYVGICEQNKDDATEKCLVPEKYLKNVRVKSMNYMDAKGPTYARYWCSKLWNGEEYFLQIDSHTQFQKGWDASVKKMYKQCLEESPKPILTHYPATKEQLAIGGSPEMCNGKVTSNKIPSFLAGWTGESDRPKKSPKPMAAAGFKFLRGEFLYEVPYDPNMPHVFVGEEVLLSARLWTHGWDYYTPNIKVCSHHYGRKEKVKYWDDLKDGYKCRAQAEKRILFMLGLLGKDKVDVDFLRDHHRYGFGKVRTLGEYWLAMGVDFEKETLEDWCNDAKPSKKFEGWNFKLDGYRKIKKYT